MRTLDFLAAALLTVRIISNLMYNAQFSTLPDPIRRLSRRHL